MLKKTPELSPREPLKLVTPTLSGAPQAVKVEVTVGVQVMVGVKVMVGLLVAVEVGLLVGERVAVEDAVSVGEFVAVKLGVKVEVIVAVKLGVGVELGVGLLVGVLDGVRVGLFVGEQEVQAVKVEVAAGWGVAVGAAGLVGPLLFPQAIGSRTNPAKNPNITIFAMDFMREYYSSPPNSSS